MTDDRMAGTAKNLGGKLQEGYGSATGDFAQEAKGKMRQVEGAAQDLYGQAKDALSDAARMRRTAPSRHATSSARSSRSDLIRSRSLPCGRLLYRAHGPSRL